MFDHVVDSPGLVIVRLYSWNKGAITFGYHQDECKVVNHSKLNGTPLIRRITGGRALYHEPSELTYSIAVNTSGLSNQFLNGTISTTSENISMALVEFLNEMKIEAQYMRQSSAEFLDNSRFHIQPCFKSRGRYEIVGENGKIIASAQKRRGDAFLQHGAIKINGIKNHPSLPVLSNNSLDHRAIHAIDEQSFAGFSNLFKNSLNKALGLNLEARELNSGEKAEIDMISNVISKISQNRKESIKQNEGRDSLSID